MGRGSIKFFLALPMRRTVSNVTLLFKKSSYQRAEKESEATDNHISTKILLQLVTFHEYFELKLNILTLNAI